MEHPIYNLNLPQNTKFSNFLGQVLREDAEEEGVAGCAREGAHRGEALRVHHLRQRLQERGRIGAAQETSPQDSRAAGHQGPQREEGSQEEVSMRLNT